MPGREWLGSIKEKKSSIDLIFLPVTQLYLYVWDGGKEKTLSFQKLPVYPFTGIFPGYGTLSYVVIRRYTRRPYLAGYYNFKTNILFTFQAIKNLCDVLNPHIYISSFFVIS